jgi:hypothetical protein
MLHTHYYFIEPRPEAATRFRDRDHQDFADILLEPVLISDAAADRSGWRHEDHVLRVKLLYLARIREWPPCASDEDARKWFGGDRVSGEVFDRWWTIRCLDFEGSDSELAEFLGPVKEKILPTGNSLVDEWVLWAMKPDPPAYRRFVMLNGAWHAAMSLLNDRGDLRRDLQHAETHFLKRKYCLGLPEDDCRAAFRAAVKIAQETIHFRRSNCGVPSPKPARRYELLRSLAELLESTCPSSDPVLIMAGCKLLEMHWDHYKYDET